MGETEEGGCRETEEENKGILKLFSLANKEKNRPTMQFDK